MICYNFLFIITSLWENTVNILYTQTNREALIENENLINEFKLQCELMQTGTCQ